jgi:DNA end-binding protein Ku
VSSVTGEEVAYEEVVKGYELGPDRYVIIDPNELDAMDPKATRSIDIEDFVDLADIDPIFFERPYYLVPDPAGGRAYALLRDALKESGKVGIARLVLRTKQYLAAIRPLGDALVLETMLYSDEVVDVGELDGIPATAEVSEKERQIARQLIDSLSTEFEPSKYRDEYRERVLELIEAKAEGQVVAVQAPVEEDDGDVVDLMAALEASLNAVKKGA